MPPKQSAKKVAAPIKKSANKQKAAVVKKPKTVVAPSFEEKLSLWFACKPKTNDQEFVLQQIDTVLSHLSDKGFLYFVNDQISNVTEADFNRFNKLRHEMVSNFEQMEKAIAEKKDCEQFRKRIFALVTQSDRISKKYE